MDTLSNLPEELRSTSVIDVLPLFNQLSEVLFWVKDRQLRICMLNAAFAERVNLAPSEILGKTDADLYFPELARVFMEDDRTVMQEGQALVCKYELLANRFGGVEWRSTTKIPIRDVQGRVVGTTGLSQPVTMADADLPPTYREFDQLVAFAREHLSEGIDIAALARQSHISVATLQRRFRSLFGISPGEFLSQLRISRACRQLRSSSLNITQIALECGYESAAAFSRAFRRQMGTTPRAFRS
jgi:AraC-like DNA-binding protein